MGSRQRWDPEGIPGGGVPSTPSWHCSTDHDRSEALRTLLSTSCPWQRRGRGGLAGCSGKPPCWLHKRNTGPGAAPSLSPEPSEPLVVKPAQQKETKAGVHSRGTGSPGQPLGDFPPVQVEQDFLEPSMGCCARESCPATQQQCTLISFFFFPLLQNCSIKSQCAGKNTSFHVASKPDVSCRGRNLGQL